jgi:hypothetical protein
MKIELRKLSDVKPFHEESMNGLGGEPRNAPHSLNLQRANRHQHNVVNAPIQVGGKPCGCL